MKRTFLHFFGAVALIAIIYSCGGRTSPGNQGEQAADTLAVPDTGFTGIKQYTSQSYLIKEVTFKNGIRHGLMKTFYQNGKLRQTFWYENGLRQDSSRWYYLEGQLFRTTPYKNDTVDGIQKQYYRTGRLKARIGYSRGFRTPYLEEYGSDGKLVTGYPELLVNTKDEYSSKGTYRITLSLSDKSTRVRYYLGDMSAGVFDTTAVKKISQSKGIANIILRKTSSGGRNSVDVIAEILTGFGNNNLVWKKIDLPYNDLK